MVIGDFDVHRALLGPAEGHSPLIIYSDAVAPGQMAAKGFQVMGWQYPKARKPRCRNHALQPHPDPSQYIRRKTGDRLAVEWTSRLTVFGLVHHLYDDAVRY